MNRPKQLALWVTVFALGCAAGGAAVWSSMLPSTRLMASWLRHAPPPNASGPIELVGDGIPDAGFDPVLRLARGSDGILWEIVIGGQPIATSRQDALARLRKMSELSTTLVVTVQALPDVSIGALQDCITEVSALGFHDFFINGVLYGTTDIIRIDVIP